MMLDLCTILTAEVCTGSQEAPVHAALRFRYLVIEVCVTTGTVQKKRSVYFQGCFYMVC
jgi:hypothetical protein